jgi:hypothetical protein
MEAYELVRAVRQNFETPGSWSQSEPGAAVVMHARDHAGNPISLFHVSSEGTSRASVNPAAVSFSIYGALVKAQETHGACVHLALLWDTLQKMAAQETGAAHGGTNYVHPLIQYNEAPGRTREQVVAFLERAEAALWAVERPVEPPAPAIPRRTEQAPFYGHNVVDPTMVDPTIIDLTKPAVTGQMGFPAGPDPAPSVTAPSQKFDPRLPPNAFEGE